MFDWKALGKGAAKVTLTALLNFLVTFAVLFIIGVSLATLTAYLLSGKGWMWATGGGILAFAECVILGAILGGKRAATMATVKALNQLRLGRMGVRLLFDRILKIRAEEPAGDRGNVAVRTVERVPLAKAQSYAEQAVEGLLRAPVEGGGLTGWVRRLIQKRILKSVELVTLAGFREDNEGQGGVDLKKVQADLEERIDKMVARKMRKGVNLLTLLVLVGVPLQIMAMVGVVLLIF